MFSAIHINSKVPAGVLEKSGWQLNEFVFALNRAEVTLSLAPERPR